MTRPTYPRLRAFNDIERSNHATLTGDTEQRERPEDFDARMRRAGLHPDCPEPPWRPVSTVMGLARFKRFTEGKR